MLASEVYALSQGSKNAGPEKCHWCGSRCDRRDTHDEPPPIIGVKPKGMAKCPHESWICRGCWLWRRPRITVIYLDQSYQDKQTPIKKSWFVTPRRAMAVAWANHAELYGILRKPPADPFFVSLIREADGIPNLLHRAVVNEFEGEELTISTPIRFTINNTEMTYTVYELDQALRNGTPGKEPGVRALIALLGPLQLPPVPEAKQENRKEGEKGRPPANPGGKDLKKPV